MVLIIKLLPQIADNDDNASPRKPYDFNDSKSLNSVNFDVACFWHINEWFDESMPEPLSLTVIESLP